MRTVAGFSSLSEADISGDPISPESRHGTRSARIVIDPGPAAYVRVSGKGSPAAASGAINLVRPTEKGGARSWSLRVEQATMLDLWLDSKV